MTLHVNGSLLRLLNECETKTWVRWGQELVMRQQEAPGPQEAGRVLHWAFDNWLQGVSAESILYDFDKACDEAYGGQLPQKERLYPQNVKLVLAHWLAEEALKPRDFTPLQHEQTFEVPLGAIDSEEAIFYGTIDGLIEWKGETYLLEHKTTGNMDESWQAQWTMSAQLQGYIWALRQQGIPVKGAFINGLEVRKLPPWDGNMSKKCSTHKLKYAECQALHVKSAWVGPLWWSEKRLAQWAFDALEMTRWLYWVRNEGLMLHGIRMDGQFKWPGCGRCTYRPWCQAGRPVEGLTQLMTHESWKREEVEAGVDDE